MPDSPRDPAAECVEAFKPLADAAQKVLDDTAWNNYPTHFHLNDQIIVDGRVGTICYNNLDGCGGVWGVHHFDTSNRNSWRDDLPAPQFMLRDKRLEARWRKDGVHGSDIECVGHSYRYVEDDGGSDE